MKENNTVNLEESEEVALDTVCLCTYVGNHLTADCYFAAKR